jgi:hypothetical protein
MSIKLVKWLFVVKSGAPVCIDTALLTIVSTHFATGQPVPVTSGTLLRGCCWRHYLPMSASHSPAQAERRNADSCMLLQITAHLRPFHRNWTPGYEVFKGPSATTDENVIAQTSLHTLQSPHAVHYRVTRCLAVSVISTNGRSGWLHPVVIDRICLRTPHGYRQ